MKHLQTQLNVVFCTNDVDFIDISVYREAHWLHIAIVSLVSVHVVVSHHFIKAMVFAFLNYVRQIPTRKKNYIACARAEL